MVLFTQRTSTLTCFRQKPSNPQKVMGNLVRFLVKFKFPPTHPFSSTHARAETHRLTQREFSSDQKQQGKLKQLLCVCVFAVSLGTLCDQ